MDYKEAEEHLMDRGWLEPPSFSLFSGEEFVRWEPMDPVEKRIKLDGYFTSTDLEALFIYMRYVEEKMPLILGKAVAINAPTT